MRKISVIVPRGFVESVLSIASDKSVDCWVNAESEGGRQEVQLRVAAESTQSVLDGLQSLLGQTDNARIVVTGVETTLPEVKESQPGRKGTASSREELLSDLGKKSRASYTVL